MTNSRRMPVLSPEDIRRISDNAVATVAAQKIVTSTAVLANAPTHGNTSNKTSGNLTQNARSTSLSQSDGRKYLQASFDLVRKTCKS